MLLEKLVIPIGWDVGIFLKGLDLIKDGVESVVGLAEKAINRTREWAEDLDQLGDVTGMAGDELASWAFITKKAGVDTGTLSRATVILQKGLVNADGTLDTMGKALKDFGIDIYGVNGKVKDQSTLMDDIAEKYATFGTVTQRVDFLTGIFERSGAELVDVFDTLAKEGGIDAVTKKVEALGLVLDPGQYEDFQRNLNEIDLTFTGLANAFTGPLLPAAEKLLAMFKTWLQSPWVADEIKNIGENLGLLLDDIRIGAETGDWTKFWGDAGAIWDALKAKVTEALQMGNNWLDANPTAITDFINGMIASLTNVVTGTPSSELGIAGQSFVDKIADQIRAADWMVFVSALNDSINAAFNKLMPMLQESFNKMMDGVLAAGWKYLQENYKRMIPISVMYTEIDKFLDNLQPPKKDPKIKPFFGGKASGGSAGGLTWVGERGPELVNLPNGSFVNRASESAAQTQIDYDQMGKSVARHLVPALQAAGLG